MVTINIWWLTTPKVTIQAIEIDGSIVQIADFAHKFLGQDLGRLVTWLEKVHGSCEHKLIAQEKILF